jgi:hypothetical protein
LRCSAYRRVPCESVNLSSEAGFQLGWLGSGQPIWGRKRRASGRNRSTACAQSPTSHDEHTTPSPCLWCAIEVWGTAGSKQELSGRDYAAPSQYGELGVVASPGPNTQPIKAAVVGLRISIENVHYYTLSSFSPPLKPHAHASST